MNEYEINDIRKQEEFRGISFSKYKKTAVKKELLNSMIEEKIEHACYWTTELICAGHFLDIWEVILSYIGKYVHEANPKIPLYVNMRFGDFKKIMGNGYVGNELTLRNNNTLRELFAELISILSFSKTSHPFDSVKIKKESDFDLTIITSKLKAPSVGYGQPIFMKEDPKELYIAINEFCYHISKDSKNVLLSCYWFEWMIEFESICKKKKEVCKAERRSFVGVQEKYQKDIVWIVWDAIFYEVGKEKRQTTKSLQLKMMNALFSLFCLRYSSGTKKKRRFLVYFAISMLTRNYDFQIPIIELEQKEKVQEIVKKINKIYKQVKQNEVSPETGYLFNGLKEQTNLEKTIAKLNLVNSFSSIK